VIHTDDFAASVSPVSRAGNHRLYPRKSHGYTRGMKIAVSVPDDVFQRAERLARRAGRSRSEVYSSALREYVARHAPEEVTDALDRVVADVGETADPFVSETARRLLETIEW
jgi:predicted transcriptional regulator